MFFFRHSRFRRLNDNYSQKFTKNTLNPDVNLNIGPYLPKNGTRRDLNRVLSDYETSTTVSIGLAGYIH